MNRRQLISGGLKAGVGLVLSDKFSGIVRPVWAASTNCRPAADRFQAAYLHLDEFIARHMNEVGAPGMTLALADRNGLLRTSQYGFADLKAGIKVQPETLFEIGSI